MFVEVVVVAALLMPVDGQAACSKRTTCVFYRDELTLSCGGETCRAVDPAEPIPTGYYLIGPHYVHEGHRKSWFNLYPFAGSRYWDYYTKVPELGCLGYLGLHSGTKSLGCITVPDNCEVIPYLKRLQACRDEVPIHRYHICLKIGCVMTRQSGTAAYIGDLCVV